MKKDNFKYSIILLTVFIVTLLSCKTDPPRWQFEQKIDLKDVTPIGIVEDKDGFWLSDGDNNRVVLVNSNGDIINRIMGIDRPMHISKDEGSIYIPSYMHDIIFKYTDLKSEMVMVGDSLDAPASIDVDGDRIAIADFYNHRILLKKDNAWFIIGEEGEEDGNFNYPTDVQFVGDSIFVADAYNNRVQLFDKDGRHLKTFGQDQGMNAATGIFVNRDQVFITDFENDRVLIFDREGNFVQLIDQELSKPTDVLVNSTGLYITNYKGKSLVKYVLK